MRLRVLSLFLLLLAVASAAFAVPPGPRRVDPNVAPAFQSVHLTIDPAKTAYSGTTSIEIVVKDTASGFLLNAEDLTITHLTISGDRDGVPASFEKREHGLIAVTPSVPLPPGEYTLRIDFTNDFNTRAVGLYRMAKNGLPYVFTQFEAADARRAFPAWDEPQYKIPWQFTLTVPLAEEALSNTVAEKTTEADGMKTIVFAKTRPLPSYLIAVAVGPFDFLTIPGMKVPARIVTPRGEAQLGSIAAGMTPRILDALERYFGTPYPYDKLDLIAVPEYWYGAMENPGAITYADSILLLDPATATPGQKRSLASITAHELAHMWFGDLVTMAWWDDLWLNESFADWMGDKITDELYPQYKLGLVEMGSVKNVMDMDSRPSSGAIRMKIDSPDEGLSDVELAYSKGKAILGMFELWTGEAKFREGVNAYLKKHTDGIATASDFFGAITRASKLDVGNAMATFLDQPGFPLIEAELLPSGDVMLSQQRFANAGATVSAQRWRVPVAVRYGDGRTTRTATFLLDRQSATFSLSGKKAKWIFPDAGGAGYYRWTLPQNALDALAADAEARLTPRERIALLNNASSLLDAGRLPGDAYFALIDRFSADPEPQVVATVVNAYYAAKLPFATQEVREAWASHVRGVFQPVIERYGMQPKEGEDATITILRPQIIMLLGSEGDAANIAEWAKTSASAWMKDPASLDLTLVNAALSIAAEHGDAALWDEFRQRFENASTPTDRNRYLALLGRFEGPAIADRALAYVFEGKLRPTEFFAIPMSSSGTPEGRDRVYRWTTENYDRIAAAVPAPFLAYLPQVATGCEAERLDAARAFFGKRVVEGSERTLEHVTDQVNDCVRLRQREGSRVNAFFESAAVPGQ